MYPSYLRGPSCLFLSRLNQEKSKPSWPVLSERLRVVEWWTVSRGHYGYFSTEMNFTLVVSSHRAGLWSYELQIVSLIWCSFIEKEMSLNMDKKNIFNSLLVQTSPHGADILCRMIQRSWAVWFACKCLHYKAVPFATKHMRHGLYKKLINLYKRLCWSICLSHWHPLCSCLYCNSNIPDRRTVQQALDMHRKCR